MSIFDDLAAASTLTDVASGARPISLKCEDGGYWTRLLKEYGIKVWAPIPNPPYGCTLLVKGSHKKRAINILRKKGAPL